jgi:hypothetical protein
MEKEFIPYEEALALKELGFDEPCMGRYYSKNKEIPIFMQWTKAENFNSKILPLDNKFGITTDTLSPFISAPLYSQAFRFFREKYGLYQIIIQNTDNDWTYDVITIKGIGDYEILDVLDSYEEAELACLKELIEIIKNK